MSAAQHTRAALASVQVAACDSVETLAAYSQASPSHQISRKNKHRRVQRNGAHATTVTVQRLTTSAQYLVIRDANTASHSLLKVAQHGVGLATAGLPIGEDA